MDLTLRRFPVIFILCVTIGLCTAKKSKVLEMNGSNWNEILEGEWMIKFYAPWCPACRAMEQDFIQFADWSDNLNVKVAEVNINEQPGLSGRFIVTALPTIYHAKNGEFRRYTGQRDSNSLHQYVEDKMWRAVEPISWYRHPNSIPMSLMSALFQTSTLIKGFHETLTEDYGLSTISAYIVFGIATIITGLVLGLVLVFIIDCISPQKPQKARPPSPKVVEQEEDAGKESAAEDEDDRESVGKGSLSSGSEKDDEEDRRRSRDASSESEDDDAQGSRASSQSSSKMSQDWEKVQGEDAERSLDIEKQIADEKEEGQGEVRRRNVQKTEE